MRRFEQATTEQLITRVQAMRGTESGDLFLEWLLRYREGCRSELETVFGDISAVTLLQGQVEAVKRLAEIINPNNITSATPPEPDRRFPWHK